MRIGIDQFKNWLTSANIRISKPMMSPLQKALTAENAEFAELNF